MNRRSFVVRTSLAAAGALFVPDPLARLFAADEPLRMLRGGAGIFTGRKGGTIGVFVGTESAFVIDTQFPDSAKECLAGVRAVTARKLDAVFITHHHGDHTAGIGLFKPEAAKVVAQRNVPDLQRAQAVKRGNVEEQTYPDTLFDESFSLDLADEAVHAAHYGPAHTGGDAIWMLEKANVVHMGDLVFHKMVPYIDLPGGASVTGWISVLERAMKTYPADAVYIFGHASEGNDVVGPREALGGMRDYLAGLLDYVRKGRAAGKTADELAGVERIPGFPEHAPRFDGAIKMNVEAAWEDAQ